MKILVTGTAGFIGFHLAKRLLEDGHEVVGLDNVNDYYDVNLKLSRLEETGISLTQDARYKMQDTGLNFQSSTFNLQSSKYSGYKFVKMDLQDKEGIAKLFRDEKFDKVAHLAAQAGVRYSLENPWAYLDSNITGFMGILEACRHNDIKHLVYASSSSVYGLNKKMPLSTSDNVDHPISLYAATKKSNELLAHSYSYLYQIPTTGLRFFTVYGPWGRPDMALFLFTKAILAGEPIDVYNKGDMVRDFTYVDDIVEGVVRVLDNIPQVSGHRSQVTGHLNPSSSPAAPYKLYNIGNSNPVPLMSFIDAIETALDKKAIMNMLPMQPGDVPKTFADVSGLEADVDYKPATKVEVGIERFIHWYKEYFK